MTDDLDKQHRIEKQKTFRMVLWIVLVLLVMLSGFAIYWFLTAPVRAVENTTESVTRQVSETATAVLTRRHIQVREGRRFSRLADAAHDRLVALPESTPANLSERAFRTAHLRGSQNKVCRMSADFGAGPVTVWAAADNADFTTNRELGGEAERQIRIVFDTSDLILGMSVQYEAMTDAPDWQLLWRRRDSLNKPLTDETAASRILDVLARIPTECSPTLP